MLQQLNIPGSQYISKNTKASLPLSSITPRYSFLEHARVTHPLTWGRLLLALIAGCCMVFAFAPFYLWPLCIILPAVLLHYCSQQTTTGSFKLGFLFGAGWFATSCYWLFISMHHFGGAPWWMAVLLLLLCLIILGVWVGSYYALLHWLWPGQHAFKYLCLYPASWIYWELLRCHTFSGFPWLLLGYSQTNSALSGWAPLAGVYGLSGITCLCAGIIAYLFTSCSKRCKIIALCAIAVIFISGQLLRRVSWVHPGKSLQTSMVQGNIPQTIKWSAHASNKILDHYAKMTANIQHSRIIVWPEAAIPIFPSYIPVYMKTLAAFAKAEHLSLLVGAPTYHASTNNYYNSMLLLGETHGQYNKQHLVPFGEYYPMPYITHFFMQKLNIPMNSFTAGAATQPALIAQHIAIAAYICYEIAFPNLALDIAKKRQLLVSISDDSWFGDSIASAQHLQMGIMQSILTRRYQLFSTNSGITALIDPYGKIIARAPINQSAVVRGKITAHYGNTPVLSYGYRPLFILAFLLICLCFTVRKKYLKI